MYHWIEDKEFLINMRSACFDLMNQLKQRINNDNYMEVDFHLVGSGARNLETQNANEPIDLDFNLNIKSIRNGIFDAPKIKEYVRKEFNKILNNNGQEDCKDSKSVLSTAKMSLEKGNKTKFSIDLAIVREKPNGSWSRLIHEKTGNTNQDRWFWNEGPQSKGLTKKVEVIKSNNHWNDVREAYLDKKNMYLKRNDHSHPSFNCYIEAVNQVYYDYFN